MKISIIIPSYNEAKTLSLVVKKVMSLKLLYPKEVIVVDDGSTDSTFKIFQQLSGYSSIKLLLNKQNLGKGASIIKAIKEATGEIIVIQDADMEYDPDDIPKLLIPFKDKNVKVVYGSRVLGGNPISHWTFNLGGRLITKLTNILYNIKITDEPTGYKLFRREVIKKFNLKSKGFEFCPEITAKIAKAGIEIAEVPISYKPRPVYQKKIKWWDGLAAIYYLVKFRFSD